MPRKRRITPAGLVFHVLNRANGKAQIFATEGDYRAFRDVLGEAIARTGMRVLAYTVMPNHWHIIEWPSHDRQVSSFMSWLTSTHARRYRTAHENIGVGHVYQGRYKSFPIQTDEHLLTAIRYVERNALAAGLVQRAEAWRWSSLNEWLSGDAELAEWPVSRPMDWVDLVNRQLTRREQTRMRTSVRRGCPFGNPAWQADTVVQLDLAATLRGPGRPRKKQAVCADNTTPFLVGLAARKER